MEEACFVFAPTPRQPQHPPSQSAAAESSSAAAVAGVDVPLDKPSWILRRLRAQFSGACWQTRTLFDVASELKHYDNLLHKDMARVGGLLEDVDAFGRVTTPASQTVIGWFLQKQLNVKCPILYSVAIAMFTAPPTTVSVERAISLVNRVVSDTRSSMSQEKIEACVVLRDLSDHIPFAMRKNLASLLGGGADLTEAAAGEPKEAGMEDRSFAIDARIAQLNIAVPNADVGDIPCEKLDEAEQLLQNSSAADWWVPTKDAPGPANSSTPSAESAVSAAAAARSGR
jgi:hypothetical protein